MSAGRTIIAIPLVLVLAGCRATAPTAPPAGYSDDGSERGEQASNADIAGRIFGIAVPADAKHTSAENFVGLVTGNAAFSRRTDSRTYIVLERAPRRDPAAFYQGSDEQLLLYATDVLQRLGIPQGEIGAHRILQEQGRSGRYDGAAKKMVSMSAIDKGKRYASFTRQVVGVPVFSSRAVFTLDPKGSIGYAEVHWPEVSQAVVSEARRMQSLVRQGWKAPERTAARVESIEAGIIHSPAPARVMDIYPAIRVVYAANDPRIGLKPMIYYDRHGKMLPAPRMFREPETTKPANQRPGGKQ